jgi:hypothetical protein
MEPAMKPNGHRVRPVAVCLLLVCIALVVSLKGDFSDLSAHRLIANPILMLVLGICLTYLGFGPFSSKQKPTFVGFLFRLVGLVILLWAALLWLFVISMISPPSGAH